MSGIAGDGKAIICENNDGLRWEPAQLTKVVPDLVANAQPNSTMAS